MMLLLRAFWGHHKTLNFGPTLLNLKHVLQQKSLEETFRTFGPYDGDKKNKSDVSTWKITEKLQAPNQRKKKN